MYHYSHFIVPLIIIVDALAIIDLIKRRNYSTEMKLLWIIIILLMPIIGISLYYLNISRPRKKKR